MNLVQNSSGGRNQEFGIYELRIEEEIQKLKWFIDPPIDYGLLSYFTKITVLPLP